MRSTRLGVGVGVGWHLAQIVIQLATEKLGRGAANKRVRDAKGEGEGEGEGEGASIGKPVISEVKRYDEKLRGLARACALPYNRHDNAPQLAADVSINHIIVADKGVLHVSL